MSVIYNAIEKQIMRRYFSRMHEEKGSGKVLGGIRFLEMSFYLDFILEF